MLLLMRNVVDNIKSSPFVSIMTVIQSSLCFAYGGLMTIFVVVRNLEFHSIASTYAETLTNAIKDVLIRLDLPMQ